MHNKFFFLEPHSFRQPMRSLWTKLVYNWRSPEQPVTTGIAPARSLRSPGYPGTDTMRCVSWRLCDTPASRHRGSFFADRRVWFPSFTFGHLSTIWPLVRSHYWANGEGHVGGSRTPIRSATGKQRNSLCSCGSRRMDRVVVSRRRSGQRRAGSRLVVNKLFEQHDDVERARLFPHHHKCWEK